MGVEASNDDEEDCRDPAPHMDVSPGRGGSNPSIQDWMRCLTSLSASEAALPGSPPAGVRDGMRGCKRGGEKV